MPTDWQERIDAAIVRVVAHALADMTVEHERQVVELKRDASKA